MDIQVTHEEGDDFGLVELRPGRDDHIEVSGYGTSGGITIKFALYAGEAREAISALQPVADSEPEDSV